MSKFGDYLKGLRCCDENDPTPTDWLAGNHEFYQCESCDELWIPSEEISRGMKEAVDLLKEAAGVTSIGNLRSNFDIDAQDWLEKYGKDFR